VRSLTLPRWLRVVIAGAALALLASCSFMELAWDRADEVIVERANDWLALRPEQEEALRARLEPWLENVRHTMLPRYADFLDELAARTDSGGFEHGDAAWAQARLATLYDDTVRSMLPWLSAVLSDLDSAQRRHLAERMRQRNADYRSEYVVRSADERERVLAERVIRQVERWTGPLDVRQKALVHRRAGDLPDTAGSWYHYRVRMQAGLLSRLDADAGAQPVAHHLEAWWVDLAARRPRQRRATEALAGAIGHLLVDLGETLSATQTQAAVRRLHTVAADLRSLAALSGADQ